MGKQCAVRRLLSPTICSSFKIASLSNTLYTGALRTFMLLAQIKLNIVVVRLNVVSTVRHLSVLSSAAPVRKNKSDGRAFSQIRADLFQVDACCI